MIVGGRLQGDMQRYRHITEGNEKRLLAMGTLALDDVHRNTARGRAQGHAQRRRRSVGCRRDWSQQPQPGIGALRGQVEPAQRFGPYIGLPQQHRAARAVLEDLLGRPQRIGTAGRLEPQQVAVVDLPGPARLWRKN